MAFKLEKLLTTSSGGGRRGGDGRLRPAASGMRTPAWAGRRQMAREWLEAFQSLGHAWGSPSPTAHLPGDGLANAQLPHGALLGDGGGLRGGAARLHAGGVPDRVLGHRPAVGAVLRKEDFGPSMPGIEKRMEQSALSVDHRELARRCGSSSICCARPNGRGHLLDRPPLRLRRPLPHARDGRRVLPGTSGRPHSSTCRPRDLHRPYEGELTGFRRTPRRIPVKAGRSSQCWWSPATASRASTAGPGGRSAARHSSGPPGAHQHRRGGVGCNDRAGDGQPARGREGRLSTGRSPRRHLAASSGPKRRRPARRSISHYDILRAPLQPIQSRGRRRQAGNRTV